ncbi:hypothetical protein [Gemmata sp.]|uniref:hypothetical protein n=1 Tax=Gemmata sp. TaxID=1914242 RepID=UPI003F725749
MRVAAVALGALVALSGCGPDPATVPQDVEGTVTLDKKNAPDGKVYFVSASGEPPVVTEVRDGAFTLKAKPGKYRVEVRMFRDRPDWPGEPHDKQINVVPARFSSESKLTTEVRADQPNTPAFALESR